MSPKPDVSAERKQQILEAAVTCFGRQGYHLTKMDDIAAEAGLSKGSLYWYFNSKKALFIGLFREIMGQFEQVWEAVIADENSSAAEKIMNTLAVFRSEFKEFASFFGVMMEAWSQTLHDDDVVELMDQFYQPYVNMMRQIIEQGIAENEFRVTNVEATTLVLLSMFDGVTLAIGMGIFNYDWDALFDAVTEVTLRALGVEQV
ncbi:MAG: TetR/AcrR family transcriptional regulator [Ardenticatenaceae bacterium]|nr:TetR/AcrR family transcriptional regulator [Ardenticatenaceae bacterium]MCB9444488.1 TetR/AcrR family transcriptional regulator [Ardenticatenaceae bacterium]